MSQFSEKFVEHILPLVEKEGVWRLSELEAAYKEERIQLWENETSAAITQVEEHAAGDAVVIILAGGSLEGLKQVYQQIEEWARSLGAKSVMINGRKGWEKALAGFKITGYVMVKELSA